MLHTCSCFLVSVLPTARTSLPGKRSHHFLPQLQHVCLALCLFACGVRFVRYVQCSFHVKSYG